MTRTEPFDLAAEWRVEAKTLRSWGCCDQAKILEHCADQLDTYAATVVAETLSLEQAAAASGYSVAHLRRLIARGVLDDVGTDGVVALRQQDLPYKAGRQRHPQPLGVLSLPT